MHVLRQGDWEEDEKEKEKKKEKKKKEEEEELEQTALLIPCCFTGVN